MKRYALLDTDFISKTHSVQDDGGNHLIDRVIELPEYEFFCHAQIVTELNRYNADTPIWLSEKIGAQKIKSYTDQEILESLSLVRGPLACATYTQMLKLASCLENSHSVCVYRCDGSGKKPKVDFR